MITIAVLHGPLLDLLGTREPAVYGTTTLAALDAHLLAWGAAHEVRVQSQYVGDEAAAVAAVRQLREAADIAAVVINPGALTHTSVLLRDALALLSQPIIEVHLSNLAVREPFRRHSLIADVVSGCVMGCGIVSYTAGLFAARELCIARKLV